jgi:hypothetical protein
MILDLDEKDFNLTMKSYEIFKMKVMEAYQLVM